MNGIGELYWDRDESALQETADEYGSYLYSIDMNVLAVHEGAEKLPTIHIGIHGVPCIPIDH